VRGGGTRTTQPLGAIVRVLDARARPEVYRFTEGRCVLGSASTCDVVIAEPTVSRTHVELALVPEGVLVEDQGSRNGTFYGGQRVQKMVLALGGRISLGAVTVAIDADTVALEETAPHSENRFRGMIGASETMRKVFATVARLEGSLVNVLIEGESGVGKELVARAIHEGSKVSAGPLVIVNCGAVARELVASELFGHRKGAFTGAVDARKGAFESADGGTLFLDEIGELPIEIQPMLLRALETGDVRPVGGDQAKNVRVRVLAATNRDLEDEVRRGRFREDLFYRLVVVRLRVPTMRERLEDVEILARAFAAAAGVTDLPEATLARLKARRWPGNVRELRNAVQAYAALGEIPDERAAGAGALDLMLGDLIDVARPYADQKDDLCERFTRLYLQALLAHTAGHQAAAAKLAGLDRTYLGRLLAKHGLSR
jgi:DNA-binding NtrC family response regulator